MQLNQKWYKNTLATYYNIYHHEKVKVTSRYSGPYFEDFREKYRNFRKMSAAEISFSTHDTLLFRKKQSRLFRTEIGSGCMIEAVGAATPSYRSPVFVFVRIAEL